jgi:hypothetical protein
MPTYDKNTETIINPDPELAATNVDAFIDDLCVLGGVIKVAIPEQNMGNGWYAFLLWYGNNCAVVQMPGVTLNDVRFLKNPGIDVYDYPRLFLNNAPYHWVSSVFRAGTILFQ